MYTQHICYAWAHHAVGLFAQHFPCIVGGGVTSAAVVNVLWHEPKFNGVSSNNIYMLSAISFTSCIAGVMNGTVVYGPERPPYLIVRLAVRSLCEAVSQGHFLNTYMKMFVVLQYSSVLVLVNWFYHFWPAQGIRFNESLMENLQLTGLSTWILDCLANKEQGVVVKLMWSHRNTVLSLALHQPHFNHDSLCLG